MGDVLEPGPLGVTDGSASESAQTALRAVCADCEAKPWLQEARAQGGPASRYLRVMSDL